MADSPRARVLLAEDHAMVAEGLAALLGQRFEVTGVVSDGREVLSAVEHHQPDVLLLDLTLPGRNGLDLIPEIRRAHPETRILVLTMHAEPSLARMAMAQGARGYLLKDSDLEELETAITEVLAGQRYMTSLVSTHVHVPLPKGPSREAFFQLSPRQQQILRAIGEGKSSRDIAQELKLSLHTVHFHRHRIRKVLGIESPDGLSRTSVIMWLDDELSEPR